MLTSAKQDVFREKNMHFQAVISEAKYFCQRWKSVILAANDVTTMGIAQNFI